MIDLHQTLEYKKYMEAISWHVERINGINYFIKKIPLLGSIIKIQRPRVVDYQSIDSLILRYRPFQIIVEPSNKNDELILKNCGYKQMKSYFIPSKTIQIDLTKSESQLLNEMHHKTRYNVKSHYSHLTTHISNDILSFAEFWQKCAIEQRGMFLSQRNIISQMHNAFGKNAHIILVKNSDSEVLSGILMICTKDIAYYMFAASSRKGKELFAPTLNAWEVITLAKKIGCKVFDFEGIYDERFPIKSWQGFTRFKKSFGGKEIAFPGAYHKLFLGNFNIFNIFHR
jgi:lipid II:glycine glycyltransferase (peptidoglycan interpeptide bridge formation enzyme)